MFYDFLDQAETAEGYLERALGAAGDQPNHILYNALGAVRLLQGDLAGALACKERALEVSKDRNQGNIHNALAGIGTVYARQGRMGEALEKYEEALERQPTDVAVMVALAELDLLQGDTDEALRWAAQATQRGRRAAYVRDNALAASAFLVYARTLLARNQPVEARHALDELYEFTVFSVRDFGMAAIIAATLPGERLDGHSGEVADVAPPAAGLAASASSKGRWGERVSPIGISALGIHDCLLGRYGDAVDDLTRAMRERAKWWPDDTRAYHWAEDARDLYVLAMAHSVLSGEVADRKLHEREAHACYDEAERLYVAEDPRFESAWVTDRVRAKAREVLRLAP